MGLAGLLILLLGWAVGHMLLILLLAVFGYLIWHLYNLSRLQRWIQQADLSSLPVSSGAWGAVFDGIYRLRKGSLRRRKRLNQLLKRFYKLAAALPDATVMLGEHDIIEWYNKPAQKLLGLQPSADVGQYIGNLIRHPAFRAYLDKGGGGEPIEMPSPADENIILSVHLVSYGKNRRLLTARNVSRLHQLQQMRRDFVADVSHELRTPLTVIAGYLESMKDGASELPPQWQHSVVLMEQQTRRMQSIVTDLLFLARMESGSGARIEEAEAVNVPVLLTTIVEDARSLSGANGHIITLDADRGLSIRANSEELRTLFSNLIFNAVQYSPAGGEITVRWYRSGKGARFEVVDSGPGIAAHHIPRLTERFYRIDAGRSREKGGTGLGLAIVKHVMNRYQGHLEIESEIGKGSLFRCCFPAAVVAAEAVRTSPGLDLKK